MAASAATTATPPFASRQRGEEGLFAHKSLASARPARPRQQRSLREPKPVLSAGKSKILAVAAYRCPTMNGDAARLEAATAGPEEVSAHHRQAAARLRGPTRGSFARGFIACAPGAVATRSR